MADRDVRADDRRLARIGVNDAQVLDVRVLAYDDPVIVAAKNGAKPDAGVLEEAHAADENGVGRDPEMTVSGKLRRDAFEFIHGHERRDHPVSARNVAGAAEKREPVPSDVSAPESAQRN